MTISNDIQKRTGLSTRDKIISSAIKMFVKNGYAGARTAEIAKDAGCAEGTIFRYFPKKIDLLKHVSEEFIKQFAGGIATKTLYEILDNSADMTGRELIEAVMTDRIKLVKENYEILKIVIYEINFHPEVKALFIEEFMTNVEDIGVKLTTALQGKLEVNNLEVMLVLRTVLGQISGIVVQNFLFDSGQLTEESLKSMIKTSSNVAVNGLRGLSE